LILPFPLKIRRRLNSPPISWQGPYETCPILLQPNNRGDSLPLLYYPVAPLKKLHPASSKMLLKLSRLYDPDHFPASIKLLRDVPQALERSCAGSFCHVPYLPSECLDLSCPFSAKSAQQDRVWARTDRRTWRRPKDRFACPFKRELNILSL
jgi:hypothetical protein